MQTTNTPQNNNTLALVTIIAITIYLILTFLSCGVKKDITKEKEEVTVKIDSTSVNTIKIDTDIDKILERLDILLEPIDIHKPVLVNDLRITNAKNIRITKKREEEKTKVQQQTDNKTELKKDTEEKKKIMNKKVERPSKWYWWLCILPFLGIIVYYIYRKRKAIRDLILPL